MPLITTLSVIQIQQEDDAGNYIKFNVMSTPTIVDPLITLDVTVLEGAGTGLTSFGPDTKIYEYLYHRPRNRHTIEFTGSARDEHQQLGNTDQLCGYSQHGQ